MKYRGLNYVANLAYEGATRSERFPDWNSTRDGPNAVLEHELDILVRRSRDAYRNVPWIKQAVDTLVNDEVGCGIVPRFRCSDKKIRDKLQSLWNIWSDECDYDGLFNFNGILSLAVTERLVAGESFILFKVGNNELQVPLQLQILESEQLPLLVMGNDSIQLGIEVLYNKRIAYHFYKNHPGERRFTAHYNDLVRVVKNDVVHHYCPTRAGQLRGDPACATSLMRMKVFDSYETAELSRKTTKSHITGFVKQPIIDDIISPITGESVSVVDGTGQINVTPGTIVELRPGEDITFTNSDDSGDNFAAFMREQKLAMAAGFNMPYELLSGDYASTNDRILKVILGGYHRAISKKQDLVTIHQVCRNTVNKWIDMAVLSGAIDIPGYADDAEVKIDSRKVDWRPEGWPYMHVLQDINAKLLKIKSGLSSRSAEAAEMGGYDIEDIDLQNQEDNKRANDLGLTYE